MKNEGRLPSWLKRPMGSGNTFNLTGSAIEELGLQTICTNANCPNRGECWSRGTATILILGNVCTRNCKFCSVACGKPEPPDPTEPERAAELCAKLNINYLVITSVDRDDLADGGAGHFRDVVLTCRRHRPGMRFELLVPDFRDSQAESAEVLGESLPFVFGHNVETVPSLYSAARPGGNYKLSLKLLEMVKKRFPDVPTKSSVMLGLGETEQEVEQVLRDLRSVGCDRVSIGQYLRPSKDSLKVVEFIEPERFESWAQKAKDMGFSWVMSSPFTRSSFHAEKESTD